MYLINHPIRFVSILTDELGSRGNGEVSPDINAILPVAELSEPTFMTVQLLLYRATALISYVIHFIAHIYYMHGCNLYDIERIEILITCN